MPTLLQTLTSLENFQATGAASEDDISSFQESFGLTIPDDYLEFLRTYGSCLWFGEAVFGIGEGEFKEVLNLDSRSHIQQSEDRVKRLKNRIKAYIPLEKYDGGGYYLLTNDGVVLIDDETPHKIVETYPSFDSYLKHKLR